MDVYVQQQFMNQSASKIEHTFHHVMLAVKQNWMKLKEHIQIVAVLVPKKLLDMLESVILIGKVQAHLVGHILCSRTWSLELEEFRWDLQKWRMWQKIIRFYIYYVPCDFLWIPSTNNCSNCNVEIGRSKIEKFINGSPMEYFKNFWFDTGSNRLGSYARRSVLCMAVYMWGTGSMLDLWWRYDL